MKKSIPILFIFLLALLPVFADTYTVSDKQIQEGEVPYNPFAVDFSECVTLNQEGIIESIGVEATGIIDLVIPSEINGQSVKGIGSGTFQGLTYLESVSIPDSVTYIGNKAFASCPNLKSVHLPSSLTYLGDEVFYQDKSLETINLPQDLKTIPKGTFKSCYNLKKIEIPSSVTKIDEEAFAHCHSLESISLPNTRYIQDKAFVHCLNLNSILISASLISVGPYTFYQCPVKQINYPGTVEEYKAKQNNFFKSFQATVVCKNGNTTTKG